MNESSQGMQGRLMPGQQHGQPQRAVLPQSSSGLAKAPGVPVQDLPKLELDSIALVDEDTSGQPAISSNIKAFGVAGPGQSSKQWQRKAHVTGQGACRVRTFHGKLSDQGMDHMDNVINSWLDNHPEVEVKLVTTSIGQFEGKIREPALVVNVWY